MSRPNSLPPSSSALQDRLPILCYVTGRRSFLGSSQNDLIGPLLEKIETAAAAGVDWIQLREKDLSGRETATLTRESLRRISKQAQHTHPGPRTRARILVNDRLDVALAEQAGGVHLGENSLPAREAKRLLFDSQAAPFEARDFLVGVSCHSEEGALSAASAGANYIFFGPVFDTPSKAAYGAAQGLKRLAEVSHSVKVPVVAIGGITLANVSSCFSAGASGIAAIRLFQDSRDLEALVHDIRQLRC